MEPRFFPIASSYILRLIYEEQLREFRDRLGEMRDPHVIYVTELVSCSQKRLFRINFPELTLGFEPPMIQGALIHRGLEELLREQGFVTEAPVEQEYVVDGETYKVKGRMDAYEPDKGVVVEIKTGRSAIGTPREHHIDQLQVYMNLVDAKLGILIYVTPDRILEYSFEKRDIVIQELVEETVHNKTHPRWSWECQYCPFNRICIYRNTEKAQAPGKQAQSLPDKR